MPDMYWNYYSASSVILKVKNKKTNIMKANMGNTDRIIRIIAGLAIGALYFFGVISGVVATVLGVLAVVFVLTGMISFCPLYAPFKLSTKKSQE